MHTINRSLFSAHTDKVSVIRKFAANEAIEPIRLNLPGYYCNLLLKFELDVEAGSTPSADTEWPAKVIKSLEVKPTNFRPYLQYEDLRYLRYENELRSRGSFYAPDLPSANGRKTVRWQFNIHPGDDYLNPYDTSEVIATKGLLNLHLWLTWGNEQDLGTGYTIHQGKVEVTVSYGLLRPGISQRRAFGDMLWQPQWHVEKLMGIKAPWPDLSYHQPLLTGLFLKEAMMLVRDDIDALRDDIVTAVQIQRKEGQTSLDKGWTQLGSDNMQDFGLTSPRVGIRWFDLREILNTGKAGRYLHDPNELKWRFTIENVSLAHPASIVVVYRTHTFTRSRPYRLRKRLQRGVRFPF